ncbi:MAG: class I SAM-dependent methyltransferase [Actinomycetota bacterium]|nr:class I SAM-dependent methyltransferase [Actinomycetota bacterium]
MSRFDDAYYRRYYGDGGVHDHARIGHLATAVHELCAWWEVPPESMLDVGAGVGMWRDWYVATHPHVRTLSIDVSEHACTTWGHEQHDIATWTPSQTFDLVVCHSVLHYLDDAAVAAAIEHLATATRYVLYLELPTEHDLLELVDPERSDMEVFRRTGTWYRRLLEPWFQQAGAGLWVRRGAVALFELEAARP